MLFSSWLRALKVFLQAGAARNARRRLKPRRVTLRPTLEVLEDRTVPSVTAIAESFTATPNTPTALEVLGPSSTASSEPVALASVGAVAPSGPTLIKNADGSLTFSGANTGTFTFNYSVTGASQEVTATDATSGDDFGVSVAISGNTAIVGNENGNSGQGAAYVFMLSGSAWNLQQEITAADGAVGDNLGVSVAIDLDTAVIGATGHAVGGQAGLGAAYVFTRNGVTWTQQQELTVGQTTDFGTSVAIGGNTVVVGNFDDAVGDNFEQGTAYVFMRTGSTWSQQQKLTAADGAATDQFGTSVAIGGNTIVVGAVQHEEDNLGQNEGGAAYVYTLSGATWTQQQELSAADEGNDDFGQSVALDGNVLVVGAEFHKVGNNFGQGAAYVFMRNGTTWNQQQELTANDGAAFDGFGGSVAIEGNLLVVGANQHSVVGNANQGAACVYTFSGSTWSQLQEITAADGAVNDNFGKAVALSGDFAVVGAPGHFGQGAAYLQDVTEATATISVQVVSQNVMAVNDSFTTITNTPTPLHVLANDTNPQATGLQVLSSTPVSPSGPTLTRNADGTFTFASAATGSYSFNYTATGQVQKVIGSDATPANNFGGSVAISGDTAVIGSPDFTGSGGNGPVYVFTLSGASWSQQQELTAPDGAAKVSFGGRVSVSGDTIVVAAADQMVGGNKGQGAAYVYTRSGTTWAQQAQLTAADGALNDSFGDSVSISGDTIVVGAEGHTVGSAGDQGAAYVYTRTGASWTQQAELTANDGAQDDFFGGSVSVSGDTVAVGAFGHTVGGNVDEGAAYVFTRTRTTWSQQREFTAADGASDDAFGSSVTVSGNTVLVGAPGHKVGSNDFQGAAYVFTRNGTTWNQQQELTAADGVALNGFGSTVGVSGDTAVIGVGRDGGDDNFQGAYFQNISLAQASVTVLVHTPAAIAATSGGGQSVVVNGAFAFPLVATVTDASGNPVSGVVVTFATPGSGAAVTFPNGNTATTNAQGQASLSVTANGTAGSYTVTASVTGVSAFAAFALTNTVNQTNVPPSITTQPSNQTAVAGATATFTAVANGTPTPTVQWQVSTDGVHYANISGATSTTLTLANVTAAMNGNLYEAVFTNVAGTATTDRATLTVTVNSSSFSYDAGTQTLTITASAPTNTFQFSQASTQNAAGAVHTTYQFSLNGVVQSYTDAQVVKVVVNGAVGSSNTAILITNDAYTGNDGRTHETAENIALGSRTDAGVGTMKKLDANANPFTFMTLRGFPVSYAYVGRNDGTVNLYGTAGEAYNGFVSAGYYSYVGGPGIYHEAAGATSVYGYSAGQPTDFAYHYAANAGSDYVASGTAYSYMSCADQNPNAGNATQSFFNVGVGFGLNTGVAKNPGQDFATFYDSPGNDTFVGGTPYSYMYIANPAGASTPFAEFDAAYAFALVHADSFVGGTDTAVNNDPNENSVAGFPMQ
jgi:hypothetical protein